MRWASAKIFRVSQQAEDPEELLNPHRFGSCVQAGTLET